MNCLPRMLPLLIALLLLAVPARADGPIRDGHVQAELVAELDAIQPGSPSWIAIRLTMDPAWHTYWRNPGDSGLATEVRWELPAGFQASPLAWPVPERGRLAGLTSLAYEGEVLLLSRLSVPAQLPPGERVTLKAQVDWLACKETCIPGQAAVTLTLPVARAASPGPDAAAFEAARARLPQPVPGLQAQAWWEEPDRRVTLALSLPPGRTPSGRVEFFPYEGNVLDLSADPVVEPSPAGYTLRLKGAQAPPEPPTRLHGILVEPGPDGWSAELDLPLQPGPAPGPASAVETQGAEATPPPRAEEALGGVDSLGAALLFAFLGGLVLNLMPCVFPVLSLKVMGFVEHGAHGRAAGLRQALIFALGVLVSFWAMAGGLLALRAGGQQLGWGFQLQSASFNVFMAVLFFGLALNLLGVFEIGLGLTRLGSVGASQAGSWGSFLSGVLATVAATPCTAPFMGSAIGFSLAQPAWVSMLVFTTLALGMASPYVLLASWPALMNRLPRPGRWMETFKQAMAFPLLLTVVYFVWVVDRQAGSESVASLLTGLVSLGLAGWIYGRWGAEASEGPARGRGLVGAILSLTLGLAAAFLGSQRLAVEPGATPVPGRPGEVAWEPWSPARLEALVKDGRPVFIDFTADWCLSCQVNERVTLSRPEVQAAFQARGVALLKADWTRRDEAITQALASYGRSGVPLYVLFPGGQGQAPTLLPEVLSPGLVLEALARIPPAAPSSTEQGRATPDAAGETP